MRKSEAKVQKEKRKKAKPNHRSDVTWIICYYQTCQHACQNNKMWKWYVYDFEGCEEIREVFLKHYGAIKLLEYTALGDAYLIAACNRWNSGVFCSCSNGRYYSTKFVRVTVYGRSAHNLEDIVLLKEIVSFIELLDGVYSLYLKRAHRWVKE